MPIPQYLILLIAKTFLSKLIDKILNRKEKSMESKIWYESKTLWVNILSVIGFIVQAKFGWIISPEYQTFMLGIINFILRIITKTEVKW